MWYGEAGTKKPVLYIYNDFVCFLAWPGVLSTLWFPTCYAFPLVFYHSTVSLVFMLLFLPASMAGRGVYNDFSCVVSFSLLVFHPGLWLGLSNRDYFLVLFLFVYLVWYIWTLSYLLFFFPFAFPSWRGMAGAWQLRNPVENFSFATVRGSAVDMFFRRKTEWANMYRVMEAHQYTTVDDAVKAVREE